MLILIKDDQEIKNLIEKTQSILKITKPYKGYIEELNYPRVLIIATGGFIMEIINVMRLRKNLQLRFVNDAKNCSLYVIKIYCEECGSVCFHKSKDKCKINYDFLVYNDTTHLECLETKKDAYGYITKGSTPSKKI